MALNPYQAYQQPYYYQQPMQPAYPSTQPQQNTRDNAQSAFIWVQGEAAAKSYLVAPGNTVALWDSEAQIIYLKSADASGMPSIKTLDYTIRDIAGQTPQVMQPEGFATMDDINALKKQIEALSKKIKTLSKEDKANE